MGYRASFMNDAALLQRLEELALVQAVKYSTSCDPV